MNDVDLCKELCDTLPRHVRIESREGVVFQTIRDGDGVELEGAAFFAFAFVDRLDGTPKLLTYFSKAGFSIHGNFVSVRLWPPHEKETA